MKTLILLITLIVVFVCGYMLGTFNAQPHSRPAPISRPNTDDPAPAN